MPYTPEQISTVTLKMKAMWKDKAMEYIKKNAEAIKANPELKQAVTSIYTDAFTGVKTPANTLTGWPVTTPPVTTPPVTTPVTTPPVTDKATTANLPQYTFDHTKDIVSVPWSPTPAAFTPTKVIGGVAINTDGQSSQQKFGIIKEQEDFLLKQDKQNIKKGMSVIERKASMNKTIADIQKLNVSKNTYGKLPTQFNDTVGDMLDLNNNGIPDSQEGFGMDKKEGGTTSIGFTDNPFGKTYNVPSNFTDVENSLIAYDTDMVEYEKKLIEDAAARKTLVTNENAKRVIDTNNAMVGNIQELLGERVQQNKEQYIDAVGAVYRQLGGQVKQFQRIIGTDGKAIDDATMLSLMWGVGVDAMSDVIDLKNTLVNDYLKQKDQAIQQIYTLQKENSISANEAASAVDAIKAQSESDVLNMTKTFYQQMFGMAQQDEARTANQQSQSRDAVTSYLAALGQTPAQINQLVNNYVAKGYSAEEALRQLSDDIRNGTNPVLNNLTKNNEKAAKAAQAKFNADMALKIEPIIAKGKVDLALQDDEQAFKKEQAALDRRAAAVRAASAGGKKPKALSTAAKTNVQWAANKWGGAAVDVENWDESTLIGAQQALLNIAGGKASTSDESLIQARFGVRLSSDSKADTATANAMWNEIKSPTTEEAALQNN